MATTDKLTALGRSVADMGDEAVLARVRPPISARLEALREARARPRRAPAVVPALRDESLRWPVAIGAALGVAASVLLVFRSSAPLTFEVGEAVAMADSPSPRAIAGQLGAWVVAEPAHTVPIGFSDGTHVELEGGARVRVMAVDAHGARVAIERGTVRADVVPRAGNDWWVVGGPFEIHVTGTSFDAGWDPEAEVLRVTMREGRVVVRAACLEHERALVAGESASLSCAPSRESRQSRQASATPAGSVAVKVAPRPSGQPVMALPSLPSVASAGPTSEEESQPAASPPASWRDLSHHGDYKAALAAAEGQGWGALCESLSASDLLELGTTARLGGRSARASEAYVAVRRRFRGGDSAAVAAFLLGQMAFDGAGALAEAHRWFSTYLAERPGGPLAADALGRSMEAEQRLGNLQAARETAQRYLSRFPSGAHADLAKSLLAP